MERRVDVDKLYAFVDNFLDELSDGIKNENRELESVPRKIRGWQGERISRRISGSLDLTFASLAEKYHVKYCDIPVIYHFLTRNDVSREAKGDFLCLMKQLQYRRKFYSAMRELNQKKENEQIH